MDHRVGQSSYGIPKSRREEQSDATGRSYGAHALERNERHADHGRTGKSGQSRQFSGHRCSKRLMDSYGVSGHAIPGTETRQNRGLQRLPKPLASSRQIRQESVAFHLSSQDSRRSVARLPDEVSLTKTAQVCFDIFQDGKIRGYSFMRTLTAENIRDVLQNMENSSEVVRNLEGLNSGKDINGKQKKAIHKIVIEYELSKVRQSSYSETSARAEASESIINRRRKYSPVCDVRTQASTTQTGNRSAVTTNASTGTSSADNSRQAISGSHGSRPVMAAVIPSNRKTDGSQLTAEGSARVRDTLESRLQGKEKFSVEPAMSSSRVMLSSKPAQSAKQREKAERVLSDDSRQLRHMLRGLCIDRAKHDQIIAIKPHLMTAGVLDHTLKYEIGLDDNDARLILECLKPSDEIDSLMNARQKADMEDQAKRDEQIALAKKAKDKEEEIKRFDYENNLPIAIEFSLRDIAKPEYDVLAVGSQIDDRTGRSFDKRRTVFADAQGHSDLNGDIHITVDAIPSGKKFKEIHFTGLPGCEFNDVAANQRLFHKLNCLMEDGGKIFVRFGVNGQDYNNQLFIDSILKPAGFGQFVILGDAPGSSGVRLSACKVKAMRIPSPKGAEASPINTSSIVTPVADGSGAAKASASQKPVTFSANQPFQKVWSPRKEQLIHIMQSAHTSFDHELIDEVLQDPRNPEFDLTAEEFATLKVRYEEWKANEHYPGLPVPGKIKNYSLRVREEKQLFEAVFGDLSASIHTPTSAASGRTFSPATPPRTEPVNSPERPFRANATQIGLPGDDLSTKVPPVKPVPFFDGASEDVIDGAGVARGRQLRSESQQSSFYDELMLNPLTIQADGLEPSAGSFIPVKGTSASCSSTPVVSPTHELSAEDQEKIRLLTHYSKRELDDDEIREAIRLGMELDESVLGLMSHQDVVEFVRQLINENRRSNADQVNVVATPDIQIDGASALLPAFSSEQSRDRSLGQLDQLHEDAFRSGLKALLNTQDDELPLDDGLSSLMADLQAIQKQAQEGKQEIDRLANAVSYPVRGYAHGTVSVMQGAGIQAARNNCAIASVLMGMSHRGSLSLLIEQIQQAVEKTQRLKVNIRIDTVDDKSNRDNKKILEALGRLEVLDRVLVKYDSKRLESPRVNDDLDQVRRIYNLEQGVNLEPDEFFERMIIDLRNLQSFTEGKRRIEIFNFPVDMSEELAGMDMAEAFNRVYLDQVARDPDSRLEDSDVLVLAPPTFGTGVRVGMILSDKIEKFDSNGELVEYQLAGTVNIAAGHYVTFLHEPENNRLYLADSMGMRLGNDDFQPFMVPTVITMPIHGTEDALNEAIIHTTNDADGALMHQTKDHWKDLNKNCRMAIYTRVNNR